MATKKKTEKKTVDATLTEQLGLRITPEERARLDAMAARFWTVGRSSIIRTALLLGLDAIDARPELLLGVGPKH